MIPIKTHLEDFIRNLYLKIGISKPSEIDINVIAQTLGINLYYGNTTFIFRNNIFLQRSFPQQEWIDFGHELCHYLRHSGQQITMAPMFIDLQEWQANHFAYHFCVPTFMLDELEEVTVYGIMNLFNVDEKFAEKRLEMYKSKNYWRMQYGKRRNKQNYINSSLL